jgi:molybdate transport system ATP-binding protein
LENDVLELDAVCGQAGPFRLRDITLGVAEGESHVLLGPSGAGKTTLLEIIVGLRPLSGGSVRFKGQDLVGVPAEKRRMGYLPQRLALFPHLTVRDNVIYGPRSLHLQPTEYQPVVDRLVEATGIGELLDRRPETLSGGERQRVALVRALAARPPLLLLDEPFSALNESLRHELWRLLKTLQAEHGFAVLMITHDLSEGFFMGDHITVLIDGAMRQNGDRESVWWRPSSVPVAQYLGIRNLFGGEVMAVEGEEALVKCPALAGTLRVPFTEGSPAPQPGDAASVAIRAEFVALRNNEHPPKKGEFVLKGRFTSISVTGTDVLVLFKPDGLDVTLEMTIGRRVLRWFGLEPGQAGTVALPASDLLLLQN